MLADSVVLTDTYQHASDFRPAAGSLYVFARSVEDRSDHVNAFIANVRAVEISSETRFGFAATSLTARSEILLRSDRALAGFWSTLRPFSSLYIDITGLSHQTWAALLRSAVDACDDIMIAYVEPRAYKQSTVPTEGEIFDLSERIEGVGSLPGFASLVDTGGDSVFVAFLGFEGARFAHIVEQVDPTVERIVPVIGVPGFKVEYPFHTFLGNKRTLLETGAWRRARFVPANCPFRSFYTLEQLSLQHPTARLTLAPIGTKPHALGCVMFKLLHADAEIVYDFPIRKKGRTEGADRLLIYHMSAILGGTARGNATI